MKTAIKIFEFAVAVFLTAFLVSMAFNYFNKGSDLNDKADKKVTNITNEISVSDITKYDGKNDLSGSDVINAIKHFQNEHLCINVNNGRSTTTYLYQSDLATEANGKISEAMDISKLNVYINPNGTFKATVDKDTETDTIIGISFEKVK